MPDIPRWHDGALWLLQAGIGEFGRVDLASGGFDPLCFVPGFARGLAFIGRLAFAVAVAGCRRFRRAALARPPLWPRGICPRRGLAVVDLRSGDIARSLTIEVVSEALCDVAVLAGLRNPAMTRFRSNKIRRMICICDLA